MGEPCGNGRKGKSSPSLSMPFFRDSFHYHAAVLAAESPPPDQTSIGGRIKGRLFHYATIVRSCLCYMQSCMRGAEGPPGRAHLKVPCISWQKGTSPLIKRVSTTIPCYGDFCSTFRERFPSMFHVALVLLLYPFLPIKDPSVRRNNQIVERTDVPYLFCRDFAETGEGDP